MVNRFLLSTIFRDPKRYGFPAVDHLIEPAITPRIGRKSYLDNPAAAPLTYLPSLQYRRGYP
jgi:hypothetical protein